MKHVLLLLFLALSQYAYSQDFQGKAIYVFNNSFADEDWSKKNMSASETRMWKSKLSEAARSTYELRFTLTESNWLEIESLSIDGGKKEFGWNESKDGLLYKSLVDNKYLLETEVFDKAFLVTDHLALPQWELTNETKNIGNYKVQKALWKIDKEVMVFGEEKPQIKTDQIVAWFSPEIPIANGPKQYWGLPGLILELQDGAITYICQKIEINTNTVEITKPNKGQKVNKAELEQIIKDKTEEIYKKYNKSSKKGK